MAASLGAVTNEVHIIGRLRDAPEVKQLPSGDEVVSFRVVVARPDEARRSARSPRSDLIDVSCYSARTRRSAARLTDGQGVEVTGAMRRRVWRTPGGVNSRLDVEASTLRAVRLD